MFNSSYHQPMPPMQHHMCGQEVIEPVIQKSIEKDCCHMVEHVCPIHTHVINKHIYNHTYRPVFTYSEEEVIVNNGCGYNNFINR